MDLASIEINILAAAVGGIAYFGLGALWYTFLFADRWMAARGTTAEQIAQEGGAGAMMALTLVAAIVSAFVIAAVYEWAGGTGPVDGLVVGAILGIGVAAMEGLKSVVYERATWMLYAINTSYVVLGFMLAGAVYALID